MDAAGWGERLRARGRELGMSDTEVARRVGMTQRRYSSYVNMTREPNFGDLLRICAGLGTTPDWVLGMRETEPADDAARRALAALARMPVAHQTLAVAALEGMAGCPEPPAATRNGRRRPQNPGEAARRHPRSGKAGFRNASD